MTRKYSITRRDLLCGSAMLTVSCSSSGKGGESRRHNIAFSQANNAEPYRAAQNALMRKLFGEHSNVQLTITDAQQDNSTQVAQVETLIRQRPDILIVAPNERAALTAVMGQAMGAGLRVICLERDILQPNYTTYVHSDNTAIGRMAGEFIVSHLKQKYGSPKGIVVSIRGLLGVEGEISRDGGAKEVLKQYPDIRMVAEPVADWIQAKAKDRMTEVLRSQPKIDVVYGHNDPMAVGAYIAASELNREKQIAFIGVDGLGGPAGGIRKVMDGVLAATFVYPLCVEKAVEVALKMLEDPVFKPDKEYTIDPTLVTSANASQMYEKYTIPGIG